MNINRIEIVFKIFIRDKLRIHRYREVSDPRGEVLIESVVRS